MKQVRNRIQKKLLCKDGATIGARIAIVILIIFGFCAFDTQPTQAETAGGSTAASYLKIGLGARSAGMGGAFTALANDGSASHWNPAGLAQSRQPELMLSHFSWLQDISIEYAAFATPVGEKAALGASFLYVNYGVIEGYQNNVQMENLSAYNYSAALTGSYRVSDRFALGASIKLISEGLADVTASTVAFDAGILAGSERLRFGVALTNVGGGLTYLTETAKLPTTLRVGVAVKPIGRSLTTAVDLEAPLGGDIVIRNGLEYSFNGSYFLRGGYSVFPSQDQREIASGVSVGGGLALANYELNYAFSPQENLPGESIHRFSFSFRFGG